MFRSDSNRWSGGELQVGEPLREQLERDAGIASGQRCIEACVDAVAKGDALVGVLAVPCCGTPWLKLFSFSLRSPHLLDYHRYPLPHPDAHGGEPEVHVVAPPHLVHERGEDPSPRTPYGMPDSDRAPVRVEPLVLGVHPPLVEDR